MIGEVAGPELRSEGGYSLAGICYDAPGLHGPILRDCVEEVRVVDSLVTGNELFLRSVLDVTEVLPAFKFESLILSESCKGFILLDLLKRCELKSTFGYSRAALFNLAHGVRKSVKLCNVLGREDDSSLSIDNNGSGLGLDQDGFELT